ncbi:MAG: hypothetical protein KAU14_05635 [Thermoplasmata archaeon]|nr:hypothetical protein [Thermoplasmata archaeon]
MKCPRCRTKIDKHSTICLKCGSLLNFIDVGDASVGLVFVWFIVLIPLIFGGGVALVAIGISDGNIFYGIISAILLLWTSLIYFLFYNVLGPGTLYTCDICKERNDVPVYVCPSCRRVMVKKGIGNHVLGIFMGFIVLTLALIIMIQWFADSLWFFGVIGSIILLIPIIQRVLLYKKALKETQEKLRQGYLPMAYARQQTAPAFPGGGPVAPQEIQSDQAVEQGPEESFDYENRGAA